MWLSMLMLCSEVDKSVTLEATLCVCVCVCVCVCACLRACAILKPQLVALSSRISHSISNGVGMWEGVYCQLLYTGYSFYLTYTSL
jgi:hypothetical protein